MSHPSAFKTPEVEAAFLAASDAAMKVWPVPYEEMDISSQCDFSKDRRVYAIDVMVS